MIGALGTLVLFAITPVFARRTAVLLGSLRANFWRLVVAALGLGLWAHLAGGGIGGPSFGWFFLGGVVGFGVGGVAMFQALPRLGSNLSNLIVQCGSAIAAATVEWLWLGHRLSALQLLCVTVTLVGIVIGLLPGRLPQTPSSGWMAGAGWALLSALGQGVGAVISRKAFAVAGAWHLAVDPGTAAYQRVLGGLLVGAVAFGFALVMRPAVSRPATATAWAWVAANALSGPVLGVTCLQLALRTTPAGIVQPIVAAAPLFTIPFAAWLEGSRPRPAYYLGAALAVAGVAGLLAWH